MSARDPLPRLGSEVHRWQRDLTRLPREVAVTISRALALGDRASTSATFPDERGRLERRHRPDDHWWWTIS